MALVPDRHYESWLGSIPSLEGKLIAITGTTSGTGYYTAICAIRKNAKVLVNLNRNSKRSQDALKKFEAEKNSCGSVTQLIQVDCDLMSFKSVRSAAEQLNDIANKNDGLDVLINNAGIMAFPDERTNEGFDKQMQTNHLSHFLLTKLVFPSFELAMKSNKEVRVVQHSSMARHGTDLEFKYFTKSAPNTLGGTSPKHNFLRYHMTKLANTTFSQALHKKLIQQGYDVNMIKSVAAEPGRSETSLHDNTFQGNETVSGMDNRLNKVFKGFEKRMSSQSSADGALPLIEASFGINVQSGDFFYPKEHFIGIPFKGIAAGKLNCDKAEPETLSVANQEIVWKASEDVLGAFFSNSKL